MVAEDTTDDTMSVDTPDMADVVGMAAKGEVAKVNVAVPAFITAYDETLQQATVQPIVRWRYKDVDGDTETELPAPIAAVPVLFPQANGLAITFPVVAGDWVLLVVCDRSIDEWESTGAQDNTPQSARRHNMADAIAIPGVRPFSDPLEGVPTDRVRIGQAGTSNPTRIEVTTSGGPATGFIRIGNDSAELLDLLEQLLAKLQISFVNTGIGTQQVRWGAGPTDTINQTASDISDLLDQIREP